MSNMGIFGINGYNNAVQGQPRNEYSQEYLLGCSQSLQIADKCGDNDGQASLQEVYTLLGVKSMLDIVKKDNDNSKYLMMKDLINNLPNVLAKYAGNDGYFTPEEYADFVNNSEEWTQILSIYTSTTAYKDIVKNTEGMNLNVIF